MNFIWWLTGLLAIIMGCRFVMVLFKRMGSKENLNAIIDKAEEGMAEAGKKVSNMLKKKKGGDDERPVVTIH